MRRDFHEHMDMFSRQNAGDDLDAKFFAQLPDNRSYPLPQRAFQHLVAILRDPDDVIPMVKNLALFGGGPSRMSFRWGWSFADASSAQPGSRRRQATRRDP